MKQFPEIINIKNKDNFKNIFFENMLSSLRNCIFEHILREDENTFFDIDKWCRDNLGNDVDAVKIMIEKLMSELIDKGWNCKISYGGTALFIYSTESPPPSCFEDGF
jgi:hypothetical protein